MQNDKANYTFIPLPRLIIEPKDKDVIYNWHLTKGDPNSKLITPDGRIHKIRKYILYHFICLANDDNTIKRSLMFKTMWDDFISIFKREKNKEVETYAE